MYTRLLQSTTRLHPRAWDFIQLMRLDKPIGIYLLLWPTLWALWVAGEGVPSVKNLFIFVVGVILMRAAGCVINDYADRNFDGHVSRTKARPLASGKVTPREALVLFAVLVALSFVLVLFTNATTIWLSFGGLALAACYPFMKRYSKAHLAKHPEDQGKDLEITQRACEKFQGLPVTVVNYLEGTRFTPAKHAQQQSPYRNLLKPKSGGIAFVIAALGKQMHTVLDVTIVYPGARPPGFWALVSGQVPHVIVDIHECELPEALLEGDYSGDPHYREHFQRWVSDLWQRKDQRIDQLRSESDQA